MFYPKQKKLLVTMSASNLINCLSGLTFRTKYLILQGKTICSKTLSYLVSFSVKNSEYWAKAERSYFQTAQNTKYKNACTTMRTVLLMLILCIQTPHLAVTAENEAEILIFSLSPEKVEEQKGVLKIQISTYSPIK